MVNREVCCCMLQCECKTLRTGHDRKPASGLLLPPQFLLVTHANLLLKYSTHNTHSNKPWIATGIKTSCQHKRELYLISRDSNNYKLKVHNKSYCLILSKVIKAVKQLYYNNKISKSNNEIKTIWDIIKMETC
jgi:hypothetical protein